MCWSLTFVEKWSLKYGFGLFFYNRIWGGGVLKALITKRKKLLRAQSVQNPGCPEIDKKKKDLGSHLRRAMKTHITHVAEKYSVLVVVQFHPWFIFYFLCFKRIVIHVHYHTQKQNKIKFKPRIQYYWTATYTYTIDDQLGETPQ